MAFASTVSYATIIGNKRYKSGTYSNAAGDSGGAITTGLLNIEAAAASVNSHVGSHSPQVVFSSGSGTLTIRTDNNVNGEWWAIGL